MSCFVLRVTRIGYSEMFKRFRIFFAVMKCLEKGTMVEFNSFRVVRGILVAFFGHSTCIYGSSSITVSTYKITLLRWKYSTV